MNLALNKKDHGHDVIGYDRSKNAVDKAVSQGLKGVYTPEELIAKIESPRIIWLMLPSTDLPFLNKGDIIIDGGNSYYWETLRRYRELKSMGIKFADVGTSGGVEGARNGTCAMMGAEEEVFKYLEPLLKDICVENGYLHTGPCGSGHYVKMIHNGIEYGIMQAIGEGMLLAKGPFKLNLAAVARVWRHGSVIRGVVNGSYRKDFCY